VKESRSTPAAPGRCTASTLREEVKPVRATLRVFYNLLSVSWPITAWEGRLHLKRSGRAQVRWSDIEIAWDNAAKALGVLATALGRLVEDGQHGLARRPTLTSSSDAVGSGRHR
jgi:hypothetical protein